MIRITQLCACNKGDDPWGGKNEAQRRIGRAREAEHFQLCRTAVYAPDKHQRKGYAEKQNGIAKIVFNRKITIVISRKAREQAQHEPYCQRQMEIYQMPEIVLIRHERYAHNDEIKGA